MLHGPAIKCRGTLRTAATEEVHGRDVWNRVQGDEFIFVRCTSSTPKRPCVTLSSSWRGRSQENLLGMMVNPDKPAVQLSQVVA